MGVKLKGTETLQQMYLVICSHPPSERGQQIAICHSLRFATLSGLHSAWTFRILMPFGISCVCVQLCLSLCNPMDCSPPGSSVYGFFPGKNTRVGFHFLLHLISLTKHNNNDSKKKKSKMRVLKGFLFYQFNARVQICQWA